MPAAEEAGAADEAGGAAVDDGASGAAVLEAVPGMGIVTPAVRQRLYANVSASEGGC
jgi:hypothetical protein